MRQIFKAIHILSPIQVILSTCLAEEDVAQDAGVATQDIEIKPQDAQSTNTNQQAAIVGTTATGTTATATASTGTQNGGNLFLDIYDTGKDFIGCLFAPIRKAFIDTCDKASIAIDDVAYAAENDQIMPDSVDEEYSSQ